MALVYVGIGWLLGVATAAAAFSFVAVVWAGAAAVAVTMSLRLSPRLVSLVVLAALFAALGHWRYQEALPHTPMPLTRYVQDGGTQLRLQGIVTDEPDQRAVSQRVRLSVREVLVEGRWQPIDGDILLYVSSGARYSYGDLLDVQGRLQAPPSFDGFDYSEYLMRRGIAGVIYRPWVELLAEGQGSPVRAALFGLRQRLSDALSATLPEPQAALAQAILLGRRTAIPQSFTDDLNATGTSHLIAISGQNVVILAGLLIAGLGGLVGYRPAAAITAVVLVAYAVLTGAPPSVQRATAMGILYVMATALGRQSSGPVSLALAGAVMTALDPRLIEDAAFQLSFAATVGLFLLSPHLHALGRRLVAGGRGGELPAGPVDMLLGLLAATLAAIAFTLPITAAHFGRVSLVAPLANLLAVPVFPLMMLGAAVVSFVGAVNSTLAAPLAWLAWLPLSVLIWVAETLARAPLASLAVAGFGMGHIAASYAVLAVITWRLGHASASVDEPEAGRPLPLPSLSPRAALLGIGALAVATATLWAYLLWPSGERLTVTFLDVGQGDAILIEAPNGSRILVDGGPSGQAITNALSERLPFWDRRIDLVVLTHPQEDHMAGLVAVLERYRVGGFLSPGVSSGSPAYRSLRELIKAKDITEQPAIAGQWSDLGSGTRLSVLHPPRDYDADDETNNASVVLRLSYGEVAFLLTGDIEAAAEVDLLLSGAELAATVLKVAHHGSASSTLPDFVEAVQPQVAVISAGADNPFGHPAAPTLARLADTAVLRTDLHGSITITTDGRRLWVKTERRAEAEASGTLSIAR